VNGIVEGVGRGRFAPNDRITRAAALKIIIEAAGFADVEETFQDNYAKKSGYTYVYFPDVLIDKWFDKYVAFAKEFSIVGGYKNGTFGPGRNISRAEVAKGVVKVLELQ